MIPDPPQVSDAVEAARRALPPLYDNGGGGIDKHEIADACVRAALPHLRPEGEQELRERLLLRMAEQPNLEEVVMKVWSETQHRLSEDLVEAILTAAFEFDIALNKNTEEGSDRG